MAIAIEIEELSDDLLMEILWRLPVKSLLRFRSVCKYWYALIDNPKFIALHYNRNRQSESDCLLLKRKRMRQLNSDGDGDGYCDCLCDFYSDCHCDFFLSFVTNDAPVDDLDLDLSFISDLDLYLSGCCNGVVCISDCSTKIVLCNPAKREFNLLPQPLYNTYEIKVLGFGFDPKANDYKVVRKATLETLCYNDDGSLYYDVHGDGPYKDFVDEKVELYDSSTNSWREVSAVMPRDFQFDSTRCKSLNGNIYWLCYDVCNSEARAIIAFRMSDQLFEQIAVPHLWYYVADLCILYDSLALVVYQGRLDLPVSFDIWVMNEYGAEELWTKKYTIQPPLLEIYRTLGFRQNGELLVAKWCKKHTVAYESQQMVSYNLNTQETKEYEVYGAFSMLQVLMYKESLISVVKRHHD